MSDSEQVQDTQYIGSEDEMDHNTTVMDDNKHWIEDKENHKPGQAEEDTSQQKSNGLRRKLDEATAHHQSPKTTKLTTSMQEGVTPRPTTTAIHWIAQWERENILPTEINSVLGKSSLTIKEPSDTITISFISARQKTGGLTASLAKLSEQKNTNVLQLHAFSVFWSTLLPALIVIHLNKFSQEVITKLQNVQLINLVLELTREKKITLNIPKGEIIYIQNKAQHEICMTDEWVNTLLEPMKTYYSVPNMNYII
ncbi:unnamed protein product [Parnassius apollo]|uniref:(apollo) hypothetical protein n=1 Tax=Parnassius apollo TaxID=110799 RepID=A0A8S3XZT9_PARAO|nr:unnamed protein product [Parnassius apollo]